ncbi:MAG: hypothetical protein LBI02_08175 [Opitutaceae bacterium]|nr:hypothetical protein [Opitutaceae bacterium]
MVVGGVTGMVWLGWYGEDGVARAVWMGCAGHLEAARTGLATDFLCNRALGSIFLIRRAHSRVLRITGTTLAANACAVISMSRSPLVRAFFACRCKRKVCTAPQATAQSSSNGHGQRRAAQADCLRRGVLPSDAIAGILPLSSFLFILSLTPSLYLYFSSCPFLTKERDKDKEKEKE